MELELQLQGDDATEEVSQEIEDWLRNEQIPGLVIQHASRPGKPGEMGLEMATVLVGPVVEGVKSVSVTASDGEKGLAKLRSSARPDLVISDINMPGMDGIELFKTIQQDGALAKIPWMFMSSSDRKYDALEAGCPCFLGKPFTLDDLQRAMACALDRTTVSAG